MSDNEKDKEQQGSACGGCCRRRRGEPRGKLHCTNWLADIPGGRADSEFVEVQFKNTRKGYYKNPTNIELEIGDMVVVDAQPGQDVGMVSLTGVLVELRMRRLSQKALADIKRVFRKAKPADLEKFEEAKAREHETMIKARRIAEDLKLNMKIGDVEFQGDGAKAIFYYIADERVDFRQLIKVLAETFRVRIEMKQIGARQEAGRIGGIGPCGRPLCCASWMSNFVSVATSAARYQDLSLNPQKLAGQCAKLKCCLNFEVDTYVESVKRLPNKDVRLETADATYFHFKTDIFKREITYSTDKQMAVNLVTIDADRAFEIIAMNKAGEKPVNLQRDSDIKPKEKAAFGDILGDDDLTRFDKKKRKKKKKPLPAQGEPQRQPKGDGRPKAQSENPNRTKTRQQAPAEKPDGNQPQQPRPDKPKGKRPNKPAKGNRPDQSQKTEEDKKLQQKKNDIQS
ncbi:MAG: hypothetical protein K2G24_01610 [Muribaculaceae bacterium]|nr:hypothetical protein [Muribaculaceae bacterium]